MSHPMSHVMSQLMSDMSYLMTRDESHDESKAVMQAPNEANLLQNGQKIISLIHFNVHNFFSGPVTRVK